MGFGVELGDYMACRVYLVLSELNARSYGFSAGAEFLRSAKVSD